MIREKPILFLDGECVLCNTLGLRILKIDKKRNLLLSTLDGATAAEARKLFPDFPATIDTAVFVEDGTLHLRSDAILRMVRHLPFPHSLPAILIWCPRPVRDFFYNIVARNRKRWFGTAESCAILSAPPEQILP